MKRLHPTAKGRDYVSRILMGEIPPIFKLEMDGILYVLVELDEGSVAELAGESNGKGQFKHRYPADKYFNRNVVFHPKRGFQKLAALSLVANFFVGMAW